MARQTKPKTTTKTKSTKAKTPVKAKAAAKPKAVAKSKTVAKPKAVSKPKAAAKTKAGAKPKAAAKPKTAAKPKKTAKPKAVAKPKIAAKSKTAAKPKTATKRKAPAKKPTKKTVLVTGASGFIAGHCIIRLLNEGYKVRGSVRSLARVDEVKTALGRHVDITDLSFVELDLASDEGWDAAAKGCTYIQHVASPFPNAAPEHEDDLIIPAREGALRALRAGAKAKVKRVVMTSSIAAVGYGHDRPKDYVYTEDDWSNAEGSLTAYAKSKTIAERAAWDFIESAEAGKMELSVINPGAVLGPLTSADFSPSADMVKKLLDGSVPACPAIGFACIDVRDVADAHYEAMVRPVAKGRRYCLVGEYAWMIDVSKELRKAGYASPTKKLPNIMVHIMGMFNPTIRLIKAGLGKRSNISNERLVKELGITPRSLHEMSTSMAETLVEYEIVSPKML